MSTEAEALGERIAEMAAHLDAATHRLLTDLRDYDRSNNWYEQGFQSCAKWLSWRVGMSTGTARDHLRVAHRLGDLPLIDDALRRGEVSYSKVRAMTRVATPENEAMLLEDARHCTGSQLETICRKYAVVVRASKEVDEDYDREHRTLTRHDREDGLVQITATLHADEAVIVWAALDQIARERAMREQLAAQMGIELDARALPAPLPDSTGTSPASAPPRGELNRVDALVAMAQSVVRGESQRRSPVEVVMTVAADVLRGVPAEPRGTARAVHAAAAVGAVELQVPRAVTGDTTSGFVETLPAVGPATAAPVPFAVFTDGTCVSAETARRLACDCGVVHMTEDLEGTPLSVGRKTRSIPAPIKKALTKRDQCCRFPGCTNRLYVEGHHITHWAHGGETALNNLVCVCSFHHHFVHEYGYRVELDAAQQPRFFDRLGRPVPEAPDIPSRAQLGVPAITELNRALEIDAQTMTCLWDGQRPHYGDVIDELVRIDRLS